MMVGDSNYTHFCKCGKDFDNQFEKLGFKRILDRVDIDQVNYFNLIIFLILIIYFYLLRRIGHQ